MPTSWTAVPFRAPEASFTVVRGDQSWFLISHRHSGGARTVLRQDFLAALSQHGAEYGVCQIYRNEPWHYELRLEAIEHGCPPMDTDPTHDPRTQQ